MSRPAWLDRRQGLALVLAGAMAAFAPDTAAAQPDPPIDIPAQSLSSALLEVSRQTHVIVVFSSDLVRDKRAPAVTGARSAVDAVRRLVAGQGLDYEVSSDGAITVRAAPKPSSQAPRAPPVLLVPAPPTRVEAVEVVATAPGPAAALEDKRQAAPNTDRLLDADLRGLAPRGLGGAIAALPGVTGSMDGGEERQIAVRGVGGEYTRVRINGMETLATFGGPHANGGTNRGRAFDFNVFASDLFQQARLQKTPSADLDEGSLGATVDLQTRSPFNGPARQSRLTVEALYSQSGRQARPRVSVIHARRSPDNRWGLLLSASYGERSLIDVGTNAVQWQTGEATSPGFVARDAAAPSLEALNAALHPRIPRLEILSIDQKRYGATASLQWRPDSDTWADLDVLYSKLAVERREDLLETFTFRTAGACAAPPSPACGLAAVRVRDAVIQSPRAGLTALVAGTFDNVDVRAESRHDLLETEFRQVTLRGGHRWTPRLSGRLLLGASRSDFSNRVQDTLQLDQYDVQGFAFDFRDPRRPVIDFGAAALDSTSAWRLAELRTEPNWVDNSFTTGGFDLDWIARPGLTLRLGAQHKLYRTVSLALGRSNGTVANLNADIPLALQNTLDLSLRTVGSRGFSTGGATPDRWLAPDVDKAMAALKAACGECGAFELGTEPLQGLNYAITERDSSIYAQLSLEPLGAWRWRGDLGIRYAKTAQASNGYTLDANAANFLAPIEAERHYQDLLPALNLVAEPARDLVLRLGLAKVMARPDLRSLRPGVTVSTGGLRAVSQGAPDLRPTRADTLDVALEWYFAPEALLSAAFFHKTLRTSVLTAVTAPARFDQNPFGLPDSVAVAACGRLVGCSPELPIWQFITRTDQGGGRLAGVELAGQTPLAPLSRTLAGWSVKGALTYTLPRLRYFGLDGRPFIARESLGSPRQAWTASMLYRRNGWEARASVNHRGRYLTAIPSPTGGDADGVNAVTTVEATLRYRVSSRVWLNGAASNLTNAAQRQFTDSGGLANYQHRTGREFRLGIEARF